MQVLTFLLLPKKCYHSFVASYFEFEPADKKSDYQCCTFCREDHLHFTGVFKKDGLREVLTDEVLIKRGGKVNWREFKKILKSKQTKVFKDGHAPGHAAGPIHALVMQLLSRGMLKMQLKDASKAGQEQISEKDVEIAVTNQIVIGTDWSGFTCE